MEWYYKFIYILKTGELQQLKLSQGPWEIYLGPKYFSNVEGHMAVFMVDWNVLDKLKIAVGIYKAYRLQLFPIHGL